MKKLIMFLMLLFSVFTFAQTAKTYYTCPMHPEIVSSKPGDCPKCNMTLVKKTVVVQPKVMTRPAVKPVPKIEKKTKPVETKVNKTKAEITKKENPVGERALTQPSISSLSKPISEPQATYTCPMHPEVISDKPGKCPKCGMELVEKEGQKHAVAESSKGEKNSIKKKF